MEEQGTDEILSTVSKSMTAFMVLRTTNRIPGHAISTAQPKTYFLTLDPLPHNPQTKLPSKTTRPPLRRKPQAQATLYPPMAPATAAVFLVFHTLSEHCFGACVRDRLEGSNNGNQPYFDRRCKKTGTALIFGRAQNMHIAVSSALIS